MKTQTRISFSIVLFLFFSVLSMADSQTLQQRHFFRITKEGATKAIGFSRVTIYARAKATSVTNCTIEVLVVPTPGPIQALRAHFTWNGIRVSDTFELNTALISEVALVEITVNSNASSVSRALLNPGPANPFLTKEEDHNRRLAIHIEEVVSKG